MWIFNRLSLLSTQTNKHRVCYFIYLIPEVVYCYLFNTLVKKIFFGVPFWYCWPPKYFFFAFLGRGGATQIIFLFLLGGGGLEVVNLVVLVIAVGIREIISINLQVKSWCYRDMSVGIKEETINLESNSVWLIKGKVLHVLSLPTKPNEQG